jgi:hypothetical protein
MEQRLQRPGNRKTSDIRDVFGRSRGPVPVPRPGSEDGDASPRCCSIGGVYQGHRLVSGEGTRRRFPLGAATTPAVDRGTVEGGLARPAGPVEGMRAPAARFPDVVGRGAPPAAASCCRDRTRVSPSRRSEPARPGC